MIGRRLEWWIDKNEILPKSQFRFRKRLGTQDSLSNFITDLHLSFAKNNCVVTLFRDIKEAYDNVLPETLAKIMSDIGLPYKFIRAYNIFYTEGFFFRKKWEDDRSEKKL